MHERTGPGSPLDGTGDSASALAPHGLGESELAVLRVLAENLGRVVTRQELARGANLRDLQPRRVDVLLVGVRRLVGASNLVNVRRRGWILVALPPVAANALTVGSPEPFPGA